MTREEAISVLKVLASFQGVMEYLEQHSVSVQDACNMAIKALSQEPCDDAISRQYLLDNCVVDKATMPYVPVNKIKNAPPVTQKPIECDDAISREAVKEIIARNDSTNGTVAVFTGKQVISMVNSLPMVTPIFVEWQAGCDKCAMNGSGSKYCDNCGQKSGKWIPVSERLPTREEYIESNGLFIVSDGNRSYAEYFDIYDKRMFGEPTMEGFRVDRCVSAWMPLPKPYEPQESEDKE